MQNVELKVKLMSKTNKIILSVVSGLILIVAFCCLYGFTIGGNNAIWAICLIAWSLLITASIFFFIFGKDFIKNQTLLEIAVVVLIAVAVLSYFTYGGLNRISADESQTVEYDAEIVSYVTGKPPLVDFINQQGNEIRIGVYYDFINEEEDEYVTLGNAEHILIRETPGGFGCPIYEILGFK